MEKKLLEKIDIESGLLDKQRINITKDLEKIFSILGDLEILDSKLQDTSLYSLISRDFLTIMDLYYRERDKLNKEIERVIRKRGRLGVKKARILGQI